MLSENRGSILRLAQSILDNSIVIDALPGVCLFGVALSRPGARTKGTPGRLSVERCGG